MIFSRGIHNSVNMTEYPSPSGKPFFIVDNMVRGLVRRLRLLGFPALAVASAAEARKIAGEQKTPVFLTASPAHLRHFPFQSALLLTREDTAGRLAEIEQNFSIFEQARFLSRCSVCNTPVRKIDKEIITDQLPERVYHSFSEFYQCENCGRIYWAGGHVKRMKDKLQRMGVPVGKIQ